MIGGDDHQKRRGALADGREQLSELVVHERDLAVVRAAGEALPERLGGDIGKVRVEVVHPQEERLGQRFEIRENRSVGLTRRALLVVERCARPDAHRVVVVLEATAQTADSVEDHRRDERRRPVTLAAQQVGQQLRLGPETRERVAPNAVAAGHQPRHDARVAREGQGRGTDRPIEAHAPGRQRIPGSESTRPSPRRRPDDRRGSCRASPAEDAGRRTVRG